MPIFIIVCDWYPKLLNQSTALGVKATGCQSWWSLELEPRPLRMILSCQMLAQYLILIGWMILLSVIIKVLLNVIEYVLISQELFFVRYTLPITTSNHLVESWSLATYRRLISVNKSNLGWTLSYLLLHSGLTAITICLVLIIYRLN